MLIAQALIGAPSAPVAAGSAWTSSIINTQGLNKGSVGLASDHGGTLQVQRYIDAAATIPVGALLSVAVVAGTPNSVGWADGILSSSLIVSFVNGAGAVANLSNISVDLSS